MEIERNIMAWVTRADMFVLSAWPFVLLALSLVGIALFAWTVSECVIRLQDSSFQKPEVTTMQTINQVRRHIAKNTKVMIPDDGGSGIYDSTQSRR